jgi:hypothetical protein
VWRAKRRIRRLEDEVATARADRAELRRKLEMFERIAGAAGAELPDPPWWEVPSTVPVPASLVAASQSPGQDEAPVRLIVGDTDVIAVVAGPGDPREWWSAVCQTASQNGEAS